jgi:hypothetical protein
MHFFRCDAEGRPTDLWHVCRPITKEKQQETP